VAWGAAERPDHGEAEVTGAEEERGRCCWRSSGRRRARVRVLGLRRFPSCRVAGCLGVRAQVGSRRPGTSKAVAHRGRKEKGKEDGHWQVGMAGSEIGRETDRRIGKEVNRKEGSRSENEVAD
jgi:hypothetical protein